MGRYDTAVRCAQIKDLIEENQYLTAMEEIEDMDFDKIPSIADLYLFADIFLRAEKMDIAKELYYTVYRRTASRPALYRLLMLVIRMGDIDEARDLYLAYEIVAGITLDTYELRYRLAKAEGAPRIRLIEILEDLKRDEYTEEWGLQLAKLYELEGMREKCIEECDDLKRWFGTGTIVEKAMALREKCMSPNWEKPHDDEIPEPEMPDLEEEITGFAQAPVSVEEIAPEKEVKNIGDDQVEEEITGFAQAPVSVEEIAPEKEVKNIGDDQAEEEITGFAQDSVSAEEIAPEKEVENIGDNYAEEEAYNNQVEAAAAEVYAEEPAQEESSEEIAEEPESGEEPEEVVEETEREEKSQKGFLRRLVDYFKVDLDAMDEEDEFPEELDTYKQQSTAEINVKEILAEGVDEIMEESVQAPEKEVLDVKATEKLPVESLEEKLQEMEQHKQVIKLEDTMNLESIQVKSHPLGNSTAEDGYEDISQNGVSYRSLKGTIYKLHQNEGIINFALVGGAEGISLAVAKKLFKELKKINYFEAKNIGKISAYKLDEVNLEEWAEKFIGGCMYIMDAPSLSDQSVNNLSNLIDKYQKQIVIILEGSYDEMDSFLSYHAEFGRKITYKVKL